MNPQQANNLAALILAQKGAAAQPMYRRRRHHLDTRVTHWWIHHRPPGWEIAHDHRPSIYG